MAVEITRKGMLLIISGPSGTGKGTLIAKLLKSDPSFRFSCSVTTRGPRDGERPGIDYDFVSMEEFQRLVDEDAFLEHATVHGNRYGTLKKTVDDFIEKGYNTLLDIDPQGALNVMERASEYVSVFILPPSFNDLRVRLHTRNTDKEVEIERRLKNARKEVLTVNRYQYAIINEDLELAFMHLTHIVNAEKQRTVRFHPVITQ